MTRQSIRLLLVDDHEIVRVGLRSVFAASNITVVAEAATAAGAIESALQCKPDVVLMDLRLPDGSGVEACREIRSACPEIRILFLTSYTDETAVLAAVFGGADGYVVKQIRTDTLVQVIQSVAEGQSYLDPTITAAVLSKMRVLSRGDKAPDALSIQEQRVLALLAEGKTNKEIAADLDLSSKTVKNYLSTIYQKLQVKRRAQAVAVYSRQPVLTET